MIKTHNLILFSILSLFLFSCSSHEISKELAFNSIEKHLQQKPIFESTAFIIGKTKLKTNKNKQLIQSYQELQKQGFIELHNQDTKKKWLAKDSLWVSTISITPKSAPYIIQNRNNRVVVKTLLYELKQKNNIQIVQKGKRTAQVRVFLDKVPTPFFDLKPNKPTHSEFITKDFKLKYSKDNAWIVIP